MSITEAPATDFQAWRHRRTEVKAMAYDGTEAARLHIADVVNRHSPGHALIRPTGTLLIRTQLRWAEVPAGYWVGIGYNGRLWVISDEVFVGCYDPAEGDDYNAVVDRKTAAAMVTAADEAWRDAALDMEPARAYGEIERLRLYVHQLATTAEALR